LGHDATLSREAVAALLLQALEQGWMHVVHSISRTSSEEIVSDFGLSPNRG
jgi:predicted dinucleotide-utilizing enzyme